MKPFKSITLILLVISLSFAACNKSSTVAKTKTELITQNTWQFDKATVNGVDVSAFLQACQKDNTIVFVSAGTGTLVEGPTKCSSNDPQTVPFTWNFANNETVLHVSAVLFTGGSSDFTIVTLNDTQLILSQDIDISGSSQNAVVTFKH